MKFKSKHKEVVARQITRENFVEVIEWVLDAFCAGGAAIATISLSPTSLSIELPDWAVERSKGGIKEGEWIVLDGDTFYVYTNAEFKYWFDDEEAAT